VDRCLVRGTMAQPHARLVLPCAEGGRGCEPGWCVAASASPLGFSFTESPTALPGVPSLPMQPGLDEAG